ncbi:efflux RND transporter periplasmic adaptor subunit [Natronospora cellulosivora (SeqCode)]
MKKKVTIIFIIVIIFLISISFYDFNSISQYLTGRSNLSIDISPDMLTTVQRGDLKNSIFLNAYLKPARENMLFFTQAGKIAEILVKEGERVEVGFDMAHLENNELSLEHIQAEKEYEMALLFGTPAEIQEAKLRLDYASNMLERTILKMPFTGMITYLAACPGDFISQGEVLAIAIDDSSYQAVVAVSEIDIRKIEYGQEAIVRLDSLPEKEFPGIIKSISYQAGINNGIVTIPVTVELLESNPSLRPNLSANVEIITDFSENNLVVPMSAVFQEDGKSYVVKNEEGKLKPIEVRTGMNNGIKIVVAEGLMEGEEVLINSAEYAELVQKLPEHFKPPFTFESD